MIRGRGIKAARHLKGVSSEEAGDPECNGFRMNHVSLHFSASATPPIWSPKALTVFVRLKGKKTPTL